MFDKSDMYSRCSSADVGRIGANTAGAAQSVCDMFRMLDRTFSNHVVVRSTVFCRRIRLLLFAATMSAGLRKISGLKVSAASIYSSTDCDLKPTDVRMEISLCEFDRGEGTGEARRIPRIEMKESGSDINLLNREYPESFSGGIAYMGGTS